MDGPKEGGPFYYADKLVAVAKYYGFDGWLVNIETKLPSLDYVDKMASFLRYLTDKTHEECGAEGGCVLWYDSVTCKGELRWQSALNAENRVFFDCCDGIFTDYKWKAETPAQCLEESQQKGMQRNFDVFAGIDVWGRGTYGGGGFECAKALRLIREAQLSAALFAPGWTFEGRKGGWRGVEMIERHFWLGSDSYSIDIDVGAEFPKLTLKGCKSVWELATEREERMVVEEGSEKGWIAVDQAWTVEDGGSAGWKVLEEGSGPEVIRKGQRSLLTSFKWCKRSNEFDLLLLAHRTMSEDDRLEFLSKEELDRSPVISIGQWFVGTPPKVEDEFFLKVFNSPLSLVSLSLFFLSLSLCACPRYRPLLTKKSKYKYKYR